MKVVVVPIICLLLSGCSVIRGGAESAMQSSSPTANIIGGMVHGLSNSEEMPKAKTGETQKTDATALWDQAAAPVIAQHPDFEYVVYEVLGPLLDPKTGNAQVRAAWDKERDKGPANAYRFAKCIMAQEVVSSSPANEILQVTPNTLGSGVGQDQYGRPVRYSIPNWPSNESTETLDVTPDVFGPGIGQDQYGRPVTVSP